MTPERFEHLLVRIEARGPARNWCRGKTPARAWQQCPRPSWMLWLVMEMAVDDPTRTRWCEYFDAIWGDGWRLMYDSREGQPTCGDVRRAVPWHLVAAALDREA